MFYFVPRAKCAICCDILFHFFSHPVHDDVYTSTEFCTLDTDFTLPWEFLIRNNNFALIFLFCSFLGREHHASRQPAETLVQSVFPNNTLLKGDVCTNITFELRYQRLRKPNRHQSNENQTVIVYKLNF
jgi:hypothetical protein